uniref:Secreted protein n=1 Tax=Anas platyrhynchos TaxID=8839 RepID=A0A8B9SLU6_ANAPL
MQAVVIVGFLICMTQIKFVMKIKNPHRLHLNRQNSKSFVCQYKQLVSANHITVPLTKQTEDFFTRNCATTQVIQSKMRFSHREMVQRRFSPSRKNMPLTL